MINSDKVIKIANGNNGYVTTKMIKESGIPTIELTRLIKQNLIKFMEKRLTERFLKVKIKLSFFLHSMIQLKIN